MSFRRATARVRPPSARDLLESRLFEELRHPNPAPDVQPIILAEPPEPAAIGRLFVIWDAWADRSQEERFEIILSAYARAAGANAAAEISVAMGLTTAEAAKMGIR